MKKESVLSLLDLPADAITAVLDRADALRAKGKDHEQPLAGQVVGLLFEKPSTRTRISFDVAVTHLGGSSLYMSASELQLGRGEPVSDTARVLSRYVDAVVARVFAHKTLEDLASFGSIPVFNALSDRYHPCQALADLQTIRAIAGKLEGVTLAYIGDGNNVCHSLLLGAGRTGMRLRIATPEAYRPEADVVEAARKDATASGGEIVLLSSPEEAVDQAEFLYTDVWTSMGQEAEQERRLRAFQGYRIDAALLGRAAPGARVLHCLPAHRGEEITDEVLMGPASAVWDQAENRLHAQKALLAIWGEG